MANVKIRCKDLSFRERTLNFQRIRPGQVIGVTKTRAEILVKGGWAEYVSPQKEAKPEEETKELKEVKNEETK